MHIDFATGVPVPGDVDVTWVHGSADRRARTDPAVQVHWYDPHTAILRQSKDVTFEAPFLFLLFGNDRALLLDTGATKDDSVRLAVDGLVDAWQERQEKQYYSLVVAHTHGHGDHVAGDESLGGRPNTTVVPRDVDAVRTFFGFGDWPCQVVRFDLGGRVLEITGTPGHHPASIAVHDPWTGLLLTGDTVLPGRLFVSDMPAYVDSLARLLELAESRPVTHVLGCHIEMTTAPGRDYFPGCRYQPDERALQMTVEQLRRIHAAATEVADHKGVHRYDDFIIYNGMGLSTAIRMSARGLVGMVSGALARRWRSAPMSGMPLR
jgi:glyoxylase-like metal-dependent hydrolase (beta-lactamase superfamily II)